MGWTISARAGAVASVLAVLSGLAGAGAAPANGGPCSFVEGHGDRAELIECNGPISDFTTIPDYPQATRLTVEVRNGTIGTGYERLAEMDHIHHLTLRNVDAQALEAMAGMDGLRHATIYLAKGVSLDPAVLGKLDQLLTLGLAANEAAVDFTTVTGMDALQELSLETGYPTPVTVRAGTPASWPVVRAPGGSAIMPTVSESRPARVVDSASLTTSSIKTTGYGTASLEYSHSSTGPVPGLPRLQKLSLSALRSIRVTDIHRHLPLRISYQSVLPERPAVVGDTLSISSTPSYPTDVQWHRDGVPISEARNLWYLLTAEDAGHTISARYTYGEQGQRLYWPQDQWVRLVPASTVTATYADKIRTTPVRAGLSGSGMAGRVLTASLPADVFPTAKRRYQWYQGNDPIKGATQSTYTPVGGDVDQPVHVRVTLSGANMHSMAVPSREITIKRGKITGTTPKINGKIAVGQKLTAVPGTSSPAADSYFYTWLRNGRHIGGLEGGYNRTYTLKPKDAGQRISLWVTYYQSDVAQDTKVSAATAKVAPGTITVAKPPKITGTKRSGQVLTAHAGTYSPKPGKVTYQWRSNGKPIKGATSSKLRLTNTLAKTKISVTATVTHPGYAQRSTTSPAR
jgi:hypothetical protein